MNLKFRNVNQAFSWFINNFDQLNPVEEVSRNGPVLRVQEPVVVTYQRPWERVLFNSARDANPFFHLFESLWMLAGRDDVEPLTFYNSQMKEYSDDGVELHGAYGFRWRRQFREDQLASIIDDLKENPSCRRQVLQIWDSVNDLGVDSKDIPCNTHVYFSGREDKGENLPPLDPDIPTPGWGRPTAVFPHRYLDMTVCNRSNDLVWGMLGANVVHFSYLQEYMACALGWLVGNYHQMTNNLHVYLSNWQPEKWSMKTMEPEDYPPFRLPLFQEDESVVFDEECNRFIDCYNGKFQTPFLQHVAKPMMAAFAAHKRRHYFGDANALEIMTRVHADDWRYAGTQWIKRRMEKWQQQSKANSQ